jgi:hypothetical protein
MKIRYTARETNLVEYLGHKVGDKVTQRGGIYEIESIKRTFFTKDTEVREQDKLTGKFGPVIKKQGEPKEVFFHCKKVLDGFGVKPTRASRLKHNSIYKLEKFNSLDYANQCERMAQRSEMNIRYYLSKVASSTRLSESARKQTESYKKAVEFFKNYTENENPIQNETSGSMVTTELQSEVPSGTEGKMYPEYENSSK